MSETTLIFESDPRGDSLNADQPTFKAYRQSDALVQLHVTVSPTFTYRIEGFTSVEDASRYASHLLFGKDYDLGEYLGIAGLHCNYGQAAD